MYSEDFLEDKMKYVESVLEKYGAKPLGINKKNRDKFGQRITYLYNNSYYRVDFLKFEEDEKPYMVISCTDEKKYADIGIMEDVEAFPFELTDEEFEKEVRYALEIDKNL